MIGTFVQLCALVAGVIYLCQQQLTVLDFQTVFRLDTILVSILSTMQRRQSPIEILARVGYFTSFAFPHPTV